MVSAGPFLKPSQTTRHWSGLMNIILFGKLLKFLLELHYFRVAPAKDLVFMCAARNLIFVFKKLCFSTL